MKAVKLLFAALAMSFAMNASAEGDHFTFDVKVGGVAGAGGFGFGVGYQKELKEFNNWNLAWDVVSFDYAAPFNSPADFDYLSLRTGLRLFTPTFWGGNFRAYTNLAPGYTCALWKEIREYWGNGMILGYEEKMKAHHGFGLQFGVGLQFKEKFSLGYQLQYETAGKSKTHFATFGFTF